MNILLIIADDFGMDRFSTTFHPTIDCLRSHGIYYSRAWGHPYCSPSRASIYTGVPPMSWELWDGSSRSGVYEKTDVTMYATRKEARMALDWMRERAERDKKFFCTIAFHAPHSTGSESSPVFHKPTFSPARMLDDDEMIRPNAVDDNATLSDENKYAHMVAAMDAWISHVIDGLKQSVLADTLIIFTADNRSPSEVVSDSCSDLVKGTVHPGGIHVPLIVTPGAALLGRRPTLPTGETFIVGRTQNDLVHITDLYAKIIDVAGATLPTGAGRSKSIVSTFHQTAAQENRQYNFAQWFSASAAHSTVSDGDYKMNFEAKIGTKGFERISGLPMYQLFAVSGTREETPLVLDPDTDPAKSLYCESTQRRPTPTTSFPPISS